MKKFKSQEEKISSESIQSDTLMKKISSLQTTKEQAKKAPKPELDKS